MSADADLQTIPRPGPSALPVAETPKRRRFRGPVRWWRDPWRKPRMLSTVTWAYLAWSILPVLIAVLFSFNSGRSRSSWQGFSMRWWTIDPFNSLLHDPAMHSAIVQSLKLSTITMLIAVPLGTAFAIGLDRWRGRVPSGANFTMLLSFVMPEIILGVALFLLFTNLLSSFVHLGTYAQILGLVTYQVSYPVIIVRARLLTIGNEFEEAAMDLGASPTQSVRRVLLPLLFPAIFASFALVFADTIDDFVTVRYLSSSSNTETLSIKIYSAARSSPTPEVNAAATFLLVSTLIAVVVGLIAYRAITRGQRQGSAATEFVGMQV
jgi:spermidine/putrescine transport system permease protein